MDNVQNQLKALRGFVSSLGDSLVTTLTEDINNLKSKVNPEELQGILNKGSADISAAISDVKNQAEAAQMMEKTKARMQTLLLQMNENLEQTKIALIPLFTAAHNRVNEYLLSVKEGVQPYITEYSEKLQAAHKQVQSLSPEEIVELKQTIHPLAVDIGAKLQEIMTHISATVNKS